MKSREVLADAGRKLVADVKYLYKRAAIIGAVLALLCHSVPPQYRVVCDHLADLCKGIEP